MRRIPWNIVQAGEFRVVLEVMASENVAANPARWKRFFRGTIGLCC